MRGIFPRDAKSIDDMDEKNANMRMETAFDNYAVHNYDQSAVDKIRDEFRQIRIPAADWNPKLDAPKEMQKDIDWEALDEEDEDVRGIAAEGENDIADEKEADKVDSEDEDDAGGKKKGKGKAGSGKPGKPLKGEKKGETEEAETVADDIKAHLLGRLKSAQDEFAEKIANDEAAASIFDDMHGAAAGGDIEGYEDAESALRSFGN